VGPEPWRTGPRGGIPRSTVQRIVQSLAAEGFLVSTGTAHSISLGPELLAMGAASAMDIVERTHPLLKDIARETGETVDLSRLSRTMRSSSIRRPGHTGFRRLGHRQQLSASLHRQRKAMMALMEEAELQKALLRPRQAFTKKTITQAANSLPKSAISAGPASASTTRSTRWHCRRWNGIPCAYRADLRISIPVPAIRFQQVRPQCERALRHAGARPRLAAYGTIAQARVSGRRPCRLTFFRVTLLEIEVLAANHFASLMSAERAWPSMPSLREMRAQAGAITRLASRVMRCQVTVLRTCQREAARIARRCLGGRMWLGPDILSPKATVVSSPRNSEP